MKSILKSKFFLILSAIVLGLLTGYMSNPMMLEVADISSQIFIRGLKLVSLPILFLSIMSTISGIGSIKEFKRMGSTVVKLTVGTTLIAATVAMCIFLIAKPAENLKLDPTMVAEAAVNTGSYKDHIVNLVPSNIVAPFSNGDVVGIVMVAFLFSIACFSIPQENRKTLNKFFSSMFMMTMQVAKYILYLTPIAVWAMCALLVNDIRAGAELQGVFTYVYSVVAANLVQGMLILPLLLMWNKIPVRKFFAAMLPALTTAFFTKSSAAALPETLRCAQQNAGLSKKVSNFSIPLCATINMNACAAFILITVMTVATSYGHQFSGVELVVWIFLATIAAIGNAGVPMGCYFMASAYITSMNLPLHFMSLILPFYLILDMLETAINVWSDACVTAVADKRYEEKHGTEDVEIEEEGAGIKEAA